MPWSKNAKYGLWFGVISPSWSHLTVPQGLGGANPTLDHGSHLSYPFIHIHCLYILFISPYHKHIWSLWSWVKIMISFGSHLKIAGIYKSSSPYYLVLPGITISLTHPGYTTGRSPMASWHPGQALDEMPRRDGVHQRSIVRQNAIQEQRVHPGGGFGWRGGWPQKDRPVMMGDSLYMHV